MAQMADLISEKDEEILDIKEKLYRALAGTYRRAVSSASSYTEYADA